MSKPRGQVSKNPNDPDGRLHIKLDMIILLLKSMNKLLESKLWVNKGK